MSITGALFLLVALLAVLLIAGPCQGVDLFVEVETFVPGASGGWSAEPQPGASGTVLWEFGDVKGGAGASVHRSVTIPQTGDYEVWVRYGKYWSCGSWALQVDGRQLGAEVNARATGTSDDPYGLF